VFGVTALCLGRNTASVCVTRSANHTAPPAAACMHAGPSSAPRTRPAAAAAAGTAQAAHLQSLEKDIFSNTRRKRWVVLWWTKLLTASAHAPQRYLTSLRVLCCCLAVVSKTSAAATAPCPSAAAASPAGSSSERHVWAHVVAARVPGGCSLPRLRVLCVVWRWATRRDTHGGGD
jgi:hypothetical protein